MAYKKRWDDFFDLFDSDGSGYISVEDVKGIALHTAKTFGIKEGSKEWNDTFTAYNHFFAGFIKAVDANGDGKVTRDELFTAVDHMRAGDKSSAPSWWREANGMLFHVIDANHNGEISLQEFIDFAKKVSPKTTEAEVTHAYNYALKLTGQSTLNPEAFFILNWVRATTSDATPELDVFFGFWKKE